MFVVICFHIDGMERRSESSYVWMLSDILIFYLGYSNCEILGEPQEGMQYFERGSPANDSWNATAKTFNGIFVCPMTQYETAGIQIMTLPNMNVSGAS